MQKQLLLFHNAVSAYFSGNNTMLEATMKQFSIKVYILYLSIYLPIYMFACLTGNKAMLEATMKQFSIKVNILHLTIHLYVRLYL